jgi:hypothetical protein
MKFGSVTTGIIADGLIFNMDAANRASYPIQRTLATSESGSCFNTIDLSQSGSFISNPQFITQPISASCWHFDGVDDRISINEINLGRTTFSMNFWIKRSSASHTDTLLGADMAYGQYVLVLTTSNDVIYTSKNGNYPRYWYDDLIPLNNTNWQNIVINRYNSTSADLYVNSINRGSTSHASWANYDTVVDTLGARGDNSENFEGNIASVQFYNRALSATEILHNYNALKGRFGLT